MTDQTVGIAARAGVPAVEGRLEPNAITRAQDVIIGMGNSAPTVAIGLSIAGLTAASAYAGVPVILLCGLPMIIVANSYRRLNLWTVSYTHLTLPTICSV